MPGETRDWRHDWKGQHKKSSTKEHNVTCNREEAHVYLHHH